MRNVNKIFAKKKNSFSLTVSSKINFPDFQWVVTLINELLPGCVFHQAVLAHRSPN